MVSDTGDNSERHITILIDEALCSEVFKAELIRGDFHFLIFDFVSDMIKMVSSQSLNTLLSYIQNSNHDAHLRVLVIPIKMEEIITSEIIQSLHSILPANPQFLMQQLSNIVSLHRNNYKLQEKVGRLEVDVAKQKRKSSEIELLKNAIVRNVSHELRTPLLQVKSAVSLIGEDSDDQKLVNYAKNAVSRLEIHIKNITMLGHSLDINVSPMILRDAIQYAKRDLTRIWTRQVDVERIHMKLEENLPPILADKQGLSTVLQLLMDNALKFGQENEIEIIGRKSGDKVYIAIRDNGIGIASEELHDIFDSFYQVDDTSTRPYGGAGVGLALVKLILENHQIKINVDSTLNEGSTFWFEIPYINLEDLE